MSPTSTSNRIAVFPGTFDPITLGHLDLIRRGCRLYEQLIVGVGENPEKSSMLKASQRMEIVRQVVGELGNVRVEGYAGLTVDFARRCGAGVLLRGIRDAADLHIEAAIAHTNRQVSGVETVFMLPAPQYAFISSRLVRQIAQAGGDVSGLVPPEVLAHIAKRS